MPEYDPLLTVAALNLAVVSLHRITSAKDRVILDQEYASIINNLRMGEINADPELTSLYQEIVRVIQRGRLRDDERMAVKVVRYEQKQRSIREIISDNVLKTFSLNPMEWLGNLTRSCVSEYFDSAQEEEETIRRNQDENIRLRREELDEYAELQRKLLGATWTLLRQYELSDSYRLIQNGLDKFYAATQQNNPSKRLRMLKYLEGDLAMYAPYWFYRGRAAKEAGDSTEAGKSFGKFGEVWRPVLRKNPYKAEAMKYMIEELSAGRGTQENAEKILASLGEMRANVELDDWANNIYMGMMYFTLGLKDKAVESVMCNVDFEFETEASEKLLAKFERETPPKRFAEIPAKTPEKPVKVFEAPKPEPPAPEPMPEKVPVQPESRPPEPKPVKKSLKQRAESGDPKAQYQLYLSYKERGELPELYGFIAAVCIGLTIGGAVFYWMRSQSFWWNILIVAGSVFLGLVSGSLIGMLLGDIISNFYSRRAEDWLIKAAENGHTGAVEGMFRLGEKHSRSAGYRNEAKRWYKRAALCGHIGAQSALSLHYPWSENAYMWAYLAYLCEGGENYSGNRPGTTMSPSDAKKAEAEAQKIYDNIQRRRQNNNSKEA